MRITSDPKGTDSSNRALLTSAHPMLLYRVLAGLDDRPAGCGAATELEQANTGPHVAALGRCGRHFRTGTCALWRLNPSWHARRKLALVGGVPACGVRTCSRGRPCSTGWPLHHTMANSLRKTQYLNDTDIAAALSWKVTAAPSTHATSAQNTDLRPGMTLELTHPHKALSGLVNRTS